RRPFVVTGDRRLATDVWINPAREQRFEARVDARPSQRSFHERVEAERGQMAVVEHDRLPQRDRALVVSGGLDEIEQRPGPFTVALIPRHDARAVERHSLTSYRMKIVTARTARPRGSGAGRGAPASDRAGVWGGAPCEHDHQGQR